MKIYKIGIIGFGFIGKIHALCHKNLPFYYSDLPFKTEITNISTVHMETATEAAKLLGIAKSTTEYKIITEDPDIDIVHICSPNKYHKEQLISALKNNKHIFCEKPISVNIEETIEIKKLIKNYKSITGINFQTHYFPATISAKNIIDNKLGRILGFRAAYLHSGSVNPNAPFKWKLSEKYGGGVILDLGSHILDLINYLIGDYTDVLAQTQIAFDIRPDIKNPDIMHHVDTEDAVFIMANIKRKNQKKPITGIMEASKISTGTEDELRFEIYGTKGAIRFNSMLPNQLGFYDCNLIDKPYGGYKGWTSIDTVQKYEKPADNFPGPKFSIGWIRTHLECIATYMNAVHMNKQFKPDIEQGLYIQKVIDCIKESAKKRAWIKVPERENVSGL